VKQLIYSSLAPMATSICLMAGQAPQENPRSKYWPFEVQLGASIMGYNAHNSTGPNGTVEFAPKGVGIAPSVRLSIDPICLPFGSIQLSVGYRLPNDVPLEYGGHDSQADMSHKQQFLFGAMLRFDKIKNFDFGVGVDGRNDWMYAPKKRGTETQDTSMRPWLRANARYLFDKGTNVTPFLGVEAAFALSALEISSATHYWDYYTNTLDAPLGTLPWQKAPESFTRGHFPIWEGAIVGGVRFGRRGDCTSKPAPVPVAKSETKPVQVVAKPKVDDDAAKRVAEEAARRAAEEAARLAAEEAARLAAEEAARRAAEEAARRDAEKKVTEDVATVSLIDKIKQEGFKSLLVHFETSQYELTAENKKAIAKWVNDVWNNGQYSKAFDQRRLYIIANCDERNEPVNQKLSDDRATALANYLRSEFKINVSRQKGYAHNRPIARGTTAAAYAKNRYAQLILDENDILNTGFKVIVHIEGPLVGVGR
jgi:outer membrane protein OmpA-like peptidoglycan-associated protein